LQLPDAEWAADTFVLSGDAILTFMMLAMFAGAQPGVADPRVGTWTLVSAQSDMQPPDRLSITPVADGTHIVMSGETHLDFTANSNGKQAAAPGNLGFNQIELHRIDRHQAEVREMKDGLLIGGAKDAKDPFKGDWMQDLSKSRMKQGMVVKIEADGSGGVRFTSDYSYTARFDGKPYDVRNFRNDTVELALADAHTVDETFRRDNQVTQKDRCQVSTDGKQMTCTIAATLETGQHVNERLAFRKQ
jgi:hypothetical protein